jgi:riboflavin biosynthesis pyrimidine reductase
MSLGGPGSPFELLVDREELSLADRNIVDGRGLPAEFREIYQGDWVIPNADWGLYRYSNFVVSHDGRISFAIPGHEGGGDVSGFNPHDQWLMGLLRARADAVVVGANTLRSESEHVWTAQFIFPSDGEAFASLRALEARASNPLQVCVTRSGDIYPDAAVFHDSSLHCVVITTREGATRLPGFTQTNVEVVVAGETDVNLETGFSELSSRFGVQTILCEGGPRLYAAVIEANQLDDEFLTRSPIVIGSDPQSPRPGLIEGAVFPPTPAHSTRLVNLRIAGEHLFQRTRWS